MKTMIKPPLPQWILDRYPNTPEDQIRASLDAFAKGIEPPKPASPIRHEIEFTNEMVVKYPATTLKSVMMFIEAAKESGCAKLRIESQNGLTNFIME